MGRMFSSTAAPVLAWRSWSGRSSAAGFETGARWATMVAAVVLACGLWTLVRTDGVIGARVAVHWRWTPTAEERLLAQDARDAETAAAETPPAAATPRRRRLRRQASRPSHRRSGAGSRGTDRAAVGGAIRAASAPRGRSTTPRAEWPGFRGAIATAWFVACASRPTGRSRRRSQCGAGQSGPGWSSFAVRGDLLYTQEQRGEDEIVACYRAVDGRAGVAAPRRGALLGIERRRRSARHADARRRPRLRVGATGILNALDARTGALVWSRNVADRHRPERPGLGLLQLAAGDGRRRDRRRVRHARRATTCATGDQRWVAPAGAAATARRIASRSTACQQVLLLSGAGVTSVAPVDGTGAVEARRGRGGHRSCSRR